MAALEIRDLVVRYAGRAVVDGVSLAAEAGAVTAVLGPNGAGKTTTLECAAGLRLPAAGEIRVLGAAPGAPRTRDRVAVMLQQGGVPPAARPLEWLVHLRAFYPRSEDPRRLLELVAISPDSRTPARRMSGGEQQRLKLAAALLPKPDLLMLDEPTAGLDPAGRRSLLDALAVRRDDGAAIVLTSHVHADVQELADRVVVIAAGRVVADGTLDEILGADRALSFAGPAGLDTAALLGALPDGYRVDERSPGRYVVSGAPSPQVMAAVATWLAAAGIEVRELVRGERTLEELIIEAGA